MRSIPIVTTASGRCVAPGETRWRERRSSTGPGSPSSCRRPRARTISASSTRSPTSRTIASPPRSGTSTSWCRRGAGSSCRTSPPRSTTRFSPRSTGSRRKYDRRMLVNAKCAPHYIKTVLENAGTRRPIRSRRMPNRRRRLRPGSAGLVAGRPRSGPTPEGPAGARRGRTTWGYGRTGMSPRAPTSRSSRGLFAARVSRTSGRPRSCSPTFAAAPRSAGDAGSAR